MPAPFALRLSRDGFDREARSDDLRRLAARYARDELAGRILAHHPTQLAIRLAPEALAAATRPGAPSPVVGDTGASVSAVACPLCPDVADPPDGTRQYRRHIQGELAVNGYVHLPLKEIGPLQAPAQVEIRAINHKPC